MTQRTVGTNGILCATPGFLFMCMWFTSLFFPNACHMRLWTPGMGWPALDKLVNVAMCMDGLSKGRPLT